MFLNEGEEYNTDGDLVDSRNRIIQELKSTLTAYRVRDHRESKLRDESPALNDAWEKYQTILTLTQDNANVSR